MLADLREARPGCLIHVFGPWDSNAYASAPPAANLLSLTAALEAACIFWRDNKLVRFVGDVKALTKAEAGQIYRKNYWDVIKGDQLPPGVDYAVFDFAVNSGFST